MLNRKYHGKLILSLQQTKTLAKCFCQFDEVGKNKRPEKKDPFATKGYASLLSANDIVEYVKATGMIYPFYIGDGNKSPLKGASYEGKIGDKAYVYNENGEKINLLNEKSKSLNVPGNSIVFVECDLHFRIPEFIALRFNLQIKHVHRGLLLGTGPLVDPGYWGKLCIPLHNLTDSDYEIPLDDGLIWIEFTRISTIDSKASTTGRPPLNKPLWDIDTFLEKVAYDQYGHQVGIRSSIPAAVKSAETKAKNAASDAAKAKNTLYRIGGFGSIATLVALTGLLYALFSIIPSYTSVTQNKLDKIEPILTEVRSQLTEHLTMVAGEAGDSQEGQKILIQLTHSVQQLENSIKNLDASTLAKDIEFGAILTEVQRAQQSITTRIENLEAAKAKISTPTMNFE